MKINVSQFELTRSFFQLPSSQSKSFYLRHEMLKKLLFQFKLTFFYSNFFCKAILKRNIEKVSVIFWHLITWFVKWRAILRLLLNDEIQVDCKKVKFPTISWIIHRGIFIFGKKWHVTCTLCLYATWISSNATTTIFVVGVNETWWWKSILKF